MSALVTTPTAAPWFNQRNVAARGGSVVLSKWLQGRPGGIERAGVTPVRMLPQAGGRQQRNYAAAQVSRLTMGWSTSSASANADIFRSLDAVRARSRKLANDDEYVKKWLALVATNVVGPSGFRFQARVVDPTGEADGLANNAIEAAFDRFSRRGVCDVTGRHSLRDLVRLAVVAAARDGEYLIQIIRGKAANNPFGVAFQLLDIDRLDTAYNRPASTGVNLIRMGVELNAFGRPVAYWLKTAHPGDVYAASAGSVESNRLRLPAEDIIHDFIRERPEQVRGMPWAHAAMVRLNNLGGYEEAAVIAARVGASKMGFFTTEDGNANPISTGTDQDGTDDPGLVMDADPGTFQTLPEGVSFTPFDPDYPAAMYAAFVKANLRGVASGLGVAYHALANDLEGVSFSSIRSGTLEERDGWMMVQEWVSEGLLDRVHAEFMPAALGFGQILLPNGSALPLSKLDKFMGHIWQARRWEWVDPRADIEADITAVRAGLKSPQSVAAKLGTDYEDLLVELAAAAALQQKYQFTPDYSSNGKPAAAEPPPATTAPADAAATATA